MKRTLSSLSLVILLLPIAASARSTYEQLQLDIPKVQTIIERDTADEAGEQADAMLEESPELFPSDGVELPVVPSSENDKYVTVSDGKNTVALTDVLRSAWYGPYVRDVANRNIVTGYRDVHGTLLGLFGPADPVSIAQLAKMAVRTAGLKEASCPTAVKNAKAAGDWSKPFIACAEIYNWTVYANPALDIHRPATRAEVVATLLEAFEIPFAGTAVGTTFKDVNNQTAFAPAIERAVSSGIITGYSDAAGVKTGFFGPSNLINRAEVSKILSLALQKL